MLGVIHPPLYFRKIKKTSYQREIKVFKSVLLKNINSKTIHLSQTISLSKNTLSFFLSQTRTSSKSGRKASVFICFLESTLKILSFLIFANSVFFSIPYFAFCPLFSIPVRYCISSYLIITTLLHHYCI